MKIAPDRHPVRRRVEPPRGRQVEPRPLPAAGAHARPGQEADEPRPEGHPRAGPPGGRTRNLGM